jgi:hypothetical protein
MKRREIYYEVPREQKFVISFFSTMLNFAWYLPIGFVLINSDKRIEFMLLTFVYTIFSVFLYNKILKGQEQKVLKEIDKATRKHVEEFFDYIESDRQFANDVLIKDVTLYSLEREKIGTGTVYSQLSQKKQSFFKEIE